MYTFDASLVSVQAQMAFYAKQHTYVAHVIAFAILLIPLWFLVKVLSRYPKQDLYEAIISRFPTVGRAMAFLYVLYFFYLLTRDLRMTVDFCSVNLLQNTPLGVLAGLIILSVIFLSYGGIEILGRSAELYGALLFIVLTMIPFLLFREFDRTMLMPYFDFDVPGIMAGVWLFIAYLGEIVGVAFLFSGQTLRFKHTLLGLGFGAGFLTLLAVMCLLVLGVPITSRVMYPNYELVRQIQITDFLDRFDMPLVGLWLPAMFTKIGFSLYAVCLGIKRIVPNTSGQRFVVPVGLLAFACSFWFFQNAVQLLNFNRTWPAISMMFQFVIPCILYVVLRPKPRQRQLTQ
jgi:spore germination protein